MNHATLLRRTALFALLGAACDDDGGNVGAPCETTEQCASGLICDIHDDRGSCQVPHEHDGDTSTEHEDTGHGDQATTGLEHDTAGHHG